MKTARLLQRRQLQVADSMQKSWDALVPDGRWAGEVERRELWVLPGKLDTQGMRGRLERLKSRELCARGRWSYGHFVHFDDIKRVRAVDRVHGKEKKGGNGLLKVR